MPEGPVIRRREDVYNVWNGRDVIIRPQAVGSTVVYPRLPRGTTYQGFSLREEFILARVRDIREGILWSDRRNHHYSVMGRPDIRGPL